jgi:predicted GNAT family acetyltransferase
MAGERATAGLFREISGVCTHPDFQGRGLARRLMAKVIAQAVARGEIPFLHVMCHNEGAHRLYLNMGFRDYAVSVSNVVTPGFG